MGVEFQSSRGKLRYVKMNCLVMFQFLPVPLFIDLSDSHVLFSLRSLPELQRARGALKLCNYLFEQTVFHLKEACVGNGNGRTEVEVFL